MPDLTENNTKTPENFEDGEVIIEEIGEFSTKDGRKIFGVLLTAPAEPPPLKIKHIWDRTPFRLVERAERSALLKVEAALRDLSIYLDGSSGDQERLRADFTGPDGPQSMDWGELHAALRRNAISALSALDEARGGAT